MRTTDRIGAAPTLGGGGEPGDAGGLRRGDTIDRYVVLARLGQGGMGVVYAAYDPELDRKVAVKLLLASIQASSTGGDARTRLLREAQALAQLSHPAVVAVHDVGTVGDQVWLAMEFVEGVTLATRLATPRPWREVLGLFQRAGEGLAAAHAAGLVHRDFKPDNVMVGADGRVRVMDFGLARAEASGTSGSGASTTVSASALRSEVTQAGAVMGTPAYMAPEQWIGATTDARTDQFAFCVALWEALHGVRPFAGDSQASLARQVMAGRRRDPPAGSRVPSWLRKVVERGLAPTPSRRWPSMTTLLAALASGAGRRQRRFVLAGAAAAAVAFAAGVAGRQWQQAEQVAACEARGAEVAAAWSPAISEETRGALLATGVPYAATTHERLAGRLGAFAGAWSEATTEVCARGTVEATWDAEQVRRAEACLGEGRWALEDLVAALLTADAGVVTRAVAAAAELPEPRLCLDAGWLARRPRPPQDAAAQAEALALRRALEQVGTLLALGQYAEGLVRARQLNARADALGWTPLTAQVRVTAGELAERAGERQEAERLLEEGLLLANEASADMLAAEAAALLTYTVGDRLARPEEGLRWGRLGLSLLPRLGPEGRVVEIELSDHMGNVSQLKGDYAAAQRYYARALALAEALHGPEHPAVAVVLNNLAAVDDVRGDYDAAGALYGRALKTYEAVLGPDHPHMAAFANNLGSVEFERGALDAAAGLFTRALTIRERVLGPDHADVAMPLANLAGVHALRGEQAEARRLLERALGIYERAFGPEHVEVAATLDTLGDVVLAQGEVAEAERIHARALAIREKILGPEHLEVADSLGQLADVRRARGALAEAETLYRRAIAIDERLLAADHARIAVNHQRLAEVLLGLGRADEAVAAVEPFLAPRPHEGATRGAAARFTLARALRASGGDEGRARGLAEEAAAGFRAAGAASEAAAVEGWLAAGRGGVPADR